jgi:hypothetical protein
MPPESREHRAWCYLAMAEPCDDKARLYPVRRYGLPLLLRDAPPRSFQAAKSVRPIDTEAACMLILRRPVQSNARILRDGAPRSAYFRPGRLGLAVSQRRRFYAPTTFSPNYFRLDALGAEHEELFELPASNLPEPRQKVSASQTQAKAASRTIDCEALSDLRLPFNDRLPSSRPTTTLSFGTTSAVARVATNCP